ncbi:hypothetical protein JTB14_013092 [Gonioctena quinquepunctata]|nr:hypothetical protein JTB14_013092 [Gonioctena quinquepunctata]
MFTSSKNVELVFSVPPFPGLEKLLESTTEPSRRRKYRGSRPFPSQRSRTSITKEQSKALQNAFEINPFIDDHMKNQLEITTGLPGRVIKIWFQNRRRENKIKRCPPDLTHL